VWQNILILFTGMLVFIIYSLSLFRQKCWKEILIFSLLLVIGITLNILISEGVVIPNPSDWLMQFYQPFNHLLEKAFSS
jgi:4-hydroxybenzoate polyprenyltransferase